MQVGLYDGRKTVVVVVVFVTAGQKCVYNPAKNYIVY